MLVGASPWAAAFKWAFECCRRARESVASHDARIPVRRAPNVGQAHQWQPQPRTRVAGRLKRVGSRVMTVEVGLGCLEGTAPDEEPDLCVHETRPRATLGAAPRGEAMRGEAAAQTSSVAPSVSSTRFSSSNCWPFGSRTARNCARARLREVAQGESCNVHQPTRPPGHNCVRGPQPRKPGLGDRRDGDEAGRGLML